MFTRREPRARGTRFVRCIAAAAVVGLTLNACAHSLAARPDRGPAGSGCPLSASSIDSLCRATGAGCSLPALPQSDSGKGDPELLRALWKAYDACSLAVFMLQPTTYESIYALSRLSGVRVMIVAVDLAPESDTYLQPRDFARGLVESLHEFSDRVRVREMTAVLPDGSRYRVECTGRERLWGMRADHLTGQVYPARSAEGKQTYHQAIMAFAVARLPMPSVEAHLDEWFALLPADIPRPRVRSLP